jgi:hypothetical protein
MQNLKMYSKHFDAVRLRLYNENPSPQGWINVAISVTKDPEPDHVPDVRIWLKKIVYPDHFLMLYQNVTAPLLHWI